MLELCLSVCLSNISKTVRSVRKLWDNISAYNGAISHSNRSSISSIDSISEANGRIHTQQSIVEVHSPPRDLMPDIIGKPDSPPPALSAPTLLLAPPASKPIPALPAPKQIPALPAPKPTSKQLPALPALKSTPTLSALKPALVLPVAKPIVSSVSKSAPASPALMPTSIVPLTPPPPPPPPPSTPLTPALPNQIQKFAPVGTSTPNKTDTFKSTKFSNGTSNQDEVQKELKFVLTMFREKKANSALSNDTYEVWLTQHSTPREVQAWLAAKGFSEKIRKQLEEMNGTDLFNLPRRRLEQLCGLSEGSRLNGQLTLTKNECEYKTARSSELRQVLEKARRRAEELNDKDEVSV